MQSVEHIATHKKEVKKSLFISYLLPYSLFKSQLEKLKQEHPKATHIIWAFRRLNEHGQTVEGSHDDGEPKGAAATPTLNVLRGENLINTALITVRYFGGTKLGIGGMIRAYTASAKEVVAASELLVFEPKEIYKFKTPYSLTKRYEHYFSKHNIDYHDRIFETDFVLWRVSLSQKERRIFEDFTRDL